VDLVGLIVDVVGLVVVVDLVGLIIVVVIDVV
jgi:hypothetical protein